MVKSNVTIDDNDKKNAWKVIFQLMSSVALLSIVAGVVIMILQAFDEENYPREMIAGCVCLGFGLCFLIIERVTAIIEKSIDRQIKRLDIVDKQCQTELIIAKQHLKETKSKLNKKKTRKK